MKKYLVSLCAAIVLLVAAAPAKAGLLIGPSGSDVIIATTGDDFSVGPISLGFTMPFYGSNQTQTFFNSNGNLTFGSVDTNFSNYGFPATVGSASFPRIAPFFDDLFLPPGDLRYNNSTTGQFVAIWNGVRHYSSGSDRINAEAILLGAGNSFGATPGTIVFSYGNVSGIVLSPTVGLNSGDGVNSATLAGVLGTNVNGTLNNAEAINLSNRTFTFTPNGGGFDVTEGAPGVASAVPEPATMTMLGIGVVGMFGYGLRRRRTNTEATPA